MDLSLGDSRQIIACCKDKGLLRNQTAYVLATTWHETAGTMKPVREYGGETYLKSKPYYPFVGMGYVQLTWKENYADWEKRLGVPLTSNPSLAMVPANAVRILVEGMSLGTFTKKKLSDYIDLQHSDFTSARRIINGTDKAALIAGYAATYDALLTSEGYGVEAAPAPQPAPPASVSPVPAPQRPATPPAAPAPTLWAALFAILKAIFGKRS